MLVSVFVLECLFRFSFDSVFVLHLAIFADIGVIYSCPITQ